MDSRESRWLPTVLGAAKGKVRQLINASSPHLTQSGADCVERGAGFRHVPRHAARRPRLGCATGCTQAWVLLLQRHRCSGGCTCLMFLYNENQHMTYCAVFDGQDARSDVHGHTSRTGHHRCSECCGVARVFATTSCGVRSQVLCLSCSFLITIAYVFRRIVFTRPHPHKAPRTHHVTPKVGTASLG